MNEKASVSKELNAQHAKILLGLLKLPENKECADCKRKAPRWASINLGIFICMECSGIHRSLGVHISKVRSTTLDIWLPEQVAFMQAMGNQISNNYWEADLSPEFYRNELELEKFIHAKYVDRRWVSTTSPQPMPKIIIEKPISTSRKGIPKKVRRYSLDEEFFNKETLQIAPPTSHSRAESFDLMSGIVSAPPVITFEGGSSSKNAEVGKDLFSLLYISEETQDRTVVPPSRWATFESDASTGDLLYFQGLLHCHMHCSSRGEIFEAPDLIHKNLIFLRCIKRYDAFIHVLHSSNRRRPQLD